jgi:hypothetical protein
MRATAVRTRAGRWRSTRPRADGLLREVADPSGANLLRPSGPLNLHGDRLTDRMLTKRSLEIAVGPHDLSVHEHDPIALGHANPCHLAPWAWRYAQLNPVSRFCLGAPPEFPEGVDAVTRAQTGTHATRRTHASAGDPIRQQFGVDFGDEEVCDHARQVAPFASVWVCEVVRKLGLVEEPTGRVQRAVGGNEACHSPCESLQLLQSAGHLIGSVAISAQSAEIEAAPPSELIDRAEVPHGKRPSRGQFVGDLLAGHSARQLLELLKHLLLKASHPGKPVAESLRKSGVGHASHSRESASQVPNRRSISRGAQVVKQGRTAIMSRCTSVSQRDLP